MPPNDDWKEKFPPEELAKVLTGDINLPKLLGEKNLIDPDTVMFALQTGHLLFTQGRYRDAELIFLGLRMCQPENSFHASALGAIYVSEKRFDEALMILNIAVKLDKTNYEGLFNRAQAHLGLGHSKEALVDFKAVTQVPDVNPQFSQNATGYIKLLEAASKGGDAAKKPADVSKKVVDAPKKAKK